MPESAPPAAFRPSPPRVIGLVGGIAAGKSAVAKAYAAHGLVHIDADAEGKATVAEPAILARLAAAFGPTVVHDQRLDRSNLAKLVFADATARQQLEAIVHPRIRERILAELARARANGSSALLDAPLLLETGLATFCDHLVFVAAALATRQQRAATRGWSADELQAREAAQWPLSEKSARAHCIINNDGDLAGILPQVARCLRHLDQA